MKISKFLICENPLVDDERIFILHSQRPLILAEAFHFETHQVTEWMECKRQFNIGASVDYPGELICLGALWIESVDIADQAGADKLAKVMSRMGDWYHAYLKWEDGNEL